ncbi:hypothetical protein MTR67_023114 [Solanum verrucosum]|uniref:Uncharacterized protein n=1 Tax=Solanum verrucosum TaxID=315347 RepID=A0AAF0QSW1_SOLVR|nr:hypothetical protein MTR67_023114 [Solanum verrucosum]
MESPFPSFRIGVCTSLICFGSHFRKVWVQRVNLSTIFNPQIDGYHSSIDMAPYEALYGLICISPIDWLEVSEAELIGPNLVHKAIKKVKTIQERLKTTSSEILYKC